MVRYAIAATALLAFAGLACGDGDGQETPAGPANTPIEAVAAYISSTGLDGDTFELTDPVECEGIPEEEFDINVGKVCMLGVRSEIGPGSATIVVGLFQTDAIWELTLEVRNGLWTVTDVEYVGL